MYNSCKIYGGILMLAYDSEYKYLKKAKEDVARILLQTFVREHNVQIANLVHEKLNKDEEVERILVKASVEIGNYSYQEALVEVEKIGIFRRIYLVLKKVDHRDIFINETICGLALIITIKVIVLR